MPYRDVRTSAIAHRSRTGRRALVGALALWGVWGWERPGPAGRVLRHGGFRGFRPWTRRR